MNGDLIIELAARCPKPVLTVFARVRDLIWSGNDDTFRPGWYHSV
jgi:hypothetical protein